MKKNHIRLGVGAVVGIVAFLLASQLPSPLATAEEPGPDPTPAAALTIPDLGLSNLIKNLIEDVGIILETVDQTINTTISKADAVVEAAKAFGFVNDGEGEATGVELVRMTVPDYGTDLKLNPNDESNVIPMINHKVVWIVEFGGITPPMMGPLPDPAEPPPAFDEHPEWEGNGHMWVAVDPDDGDILLAEQY